MIKKFFCMVTVILMFVSVFSGICGTAATNMVSNGSFEDVVEGVPTGWEINAGVWADALKTNGGAPQSGNNYVNLPVRTQYVSSFVENLNSDNTYEIGFWYKSTTAKAAMMTIQQYDPTLGGSLGNQIIGTNITTELATTSGAWAKYIYKYKPYVGYKGATPVVATKILIMLRNSPLVAADDATVSYDNISVTPSVGPLINGGFESVVSGTATGWLTGTGGGGSVAAVTDSATAYEGVSYIAVTGTTSNMYAQNILGVGGYKRFRLSFMYKTNTANTQPYISIAALGSTGTQNTGLAAKTFNALGAGSTTEWKKYTAYFDFASSLADGFQLMLRGSGAAVTNYYDDVVVERVDRLFFDTSNKAVATIVENSTLKASWHCPASVTTGTQTSTLLVGLYEKTGETAKLVGVAPAVSDTVSAGGYKLLESSISIGELKDSTEYLLKMFCWDTTSSMIPYLKTYVINNGR